MHSILKIGILANPIRFFYAVALLLAAAGCAYTALNTAHIGRLFIPNGAAILFVLTGMSLVIAHIVDIARLILIVTVSDKRS